MILLTIFLTLLIFSFALAPLILNNAVYAVLCFISVFLFISCILLSIGIEFLAFVYAIVYIGAVAVLFLFVVMLLQVSSQYKRALKTYWIALLIFCVTIIAIKILKILAKTISISVHIFNPDVILSGNRNQIEVDVINSTSS
jgi:NADH-quinone oxidoreductase subunit J